MRIPVLLTVLTMLICSSSYAEPIPQHKDTEELMRYMEAYQALDHVKQRFIFLGTQMSALNQNGNKSHDELALDRKRTKELEEIINREITWEKAKPLFIIVFEEVFTESERDDLLKFFRSPTGIAYREKFPQLSVKLFQAGQKLFPNIMPEIEKLIEEEEKADFEKRDKK